MRTIDLHVGCYYLATPIQNSPFAPVAPAIAVPPFAAHSPPPATEPLPLAVEPPPAVEAAAAIEAATGKATTEALDGDAMPANAAEFLPMPANADG